MYDKFFNSLLPGNYALTKSMELTKVQTSGTLWYTKKFLVLYYYIFLTKEIYTREYICKIVATFDNYIESLDVALKESAKKFFYTDNDRINFKSDKFITFSSFTDFSNFSNATEKEAYDRSARKYYFSLLMGVGGQTGIKKHLKEKIQEEGFVFTDCNIQDIILNGAKKICVEQLNGNHIISDNSVKYIISQKAIDNLSSLSKIKNICETDVNNEIILNPHSNPNYNGIKNDMIAFIRNERQILYYYGFFHSKSSGAKDFEFSSLTPVGHAALSANSYEFLAIWEHQKLKMISQPATAEINDIPSGLSFPEQFSISYTPYLDVLGTLSRRGELSVDEYMYIVSRRNLFFNKSEWESAEDTIFSHLNDIKAKVKSFDRKRDIQDEDGRKELLKYALGIRDDLSVDRNTNFLGCCKMNNSKLSVTNVERLKQIYALYTKLSEYKVQKNGDLFEKCEDDLRNRYIALSKNCTKDIDPKVKISWDLYNIREDKFIMLSLIFFISALKLNYNFLNLTKTEISDVSGFALSNFKIMLKSYGLKSLNKTKIMVGNVITSLNSNDYSEYTECEKEENQQIVAKYKNESAADLFKKIEIISDSYCSSDGERQRNASLIALLKSYYMARFLENDLLKCECCGKETFITDAGEPYVEFHHLIPFNLASGPDHYLNLFALCPNCHRKLHFLSVFNKEKEYKNIDANNYLELTIVQRLKELKNENILQSYHLEFLLAERAINQEQYDSIAA